IRHLDLVRAGHIQLAVDKITAHAFIEEFITFPQFIKNPSGRFADQIDACTQFLDYMAENPVLEPPRERAIIQGVGHCGPFPKTLLTGSFDGPVFRQAPGIVVGLKSRLLR
ncbi:MAG TPA: hypothetical protein VN728_06760, partial [Stellaceae bacterium]|nr:hypothetical protein [Stellaceae bacterium]